MKVNEGKNWLENKLKKDVKMSLPLVLKNHSPRCTAVRVYGARFGIILNKFSSVFPR